MVAPDDTAVAEGLEFIDLVTGQERACEDDTRTQREHLGAKAPKCLVAIGTVLSLLDRLASCWWGCAGGDHTIEYLTGRGVASTRAALRVSFGGYYDEALGLARSVGEVANLFALFAADANALTTWKTASKRQRLNDFGPSPVRRRLAQLKAPMPISAERYAALCELATHVTPQTRPQAHNPLSMPITGAKFQQTGYVLALNELALPIVFVAVFSTQLLKASPQVRQRVVPAARSLAESLGGVNVIDGYPRLTNESIGEIDQLVRSAAPEEQPMLRRMILDLANGSLPNPDSKTASDANE